MVQNMPGENKAGECGGKDLPISGHRAFHHTLFALCRLDNCPGRQHLAYPDRSKESGLCGTKDNVGVVDLQHCRIVGQAKGESAMNQPVFIGSHFHAGLQTGMAILSANSRGSPTHSGEIARCVRGSQPVSISRIGVPRVFAASAS